MLTQVSLSAGNVDQIFGFWAGVSAVFLLGLTALMAGFVLKYGRGGPAPAHPPEGNVPLEIVWTLTPTALFLLIFYHGWTDYGRMRNPPRDALAVAVTARQWSWSFRYPNGKESARLYAPANRPVRMEIRSADVIHGLFIPAFRLKADAVPGHVGKAWFQAERTGTFELLCTVVCGVDHSRMAAEVVVVPEAAFRAWYFGGEEAPEPDRHPGLAHLRTKGCLACHSLDGTPSVGPSFKGLLGRKEEVQGAASPRWITVDGPRVRRAIVDPRHEPVAGFPPVMPSASMPKADLDAIVDFLGTQR